MALSSRYLASIAAGCIVFLLMIVRVIFFYNAPDSVLIGVVPDDAFYYIQMARHKVIDGFWTFDGISPATGFHFLYGYFLVFIYSVFGEVDWRQLYLIVGILSSIFIGLAAYFVSRSAENLFGRKSVFLAVAPFLTPIALMQSTVMMESWLVLFFSAATIFFLVLDKSPSIFDGVILLILGVLGSLSRTDYGMLPGVIFAVYLISYPIVKNNGLKRSAFVLMGAVIGIAIVLMQNFYISGQLAQASAQTKFYWSSLAGHDIFAPIRLVMSTTLPLPSYHYGTLNKAIKIIAVLCAVCFSGYSLYVFLQAARRRKHLPELAVAAGCLLTIVGYILFYRHNSQALLNWYASNFIAPTGIVLAATGFFLFDRKILMPAIAAFCTYAFIGASSIFTVPWPHQVGMMQAGLFLKELKSDARYASWNAGIISYFSGTNLINIDGLTNDEVLPFIKSNTLFDYIISKKIDYLIDYETMLNNKSVRIRGGYMDDRIDRCLFPLQAVDGSNGSWAGARLKVYKVARDCEISQYLIPTIWLEKIG